MALFFNGNKKHRRDSGRYRDEDDFYIEEDYDGDEFVTEEFEAVDDAGGQDEYFTEEFEAVKDADERDEYFTEKFEAVNDADEGDEYFTEEFEAVNDADGQDEYYTEEFEAVNDADGQGEYYTEEFEAVNDADGQGEYYTEEFEAVNDADERDEYFTEEFEAIDDTADDVDDIETEGKRGTGRKRGRRSARRKRGGGLAAVFSRMAHASAMDKIVVCTGLFVVAFLVFLVAAFKSRQTGKQEADSFAALGAELADVEVVGKSGLLAAADARRAAYAAESVQAEETKEEDIPAAANETVNVGLRLSSILSDLKIKFVNESTGKLIANVPFRAEITYPDKKTETRTDDDMDGIIYLKDIPAGTYQVAMQALDGYEKYALGTSAQSVKVTDTLEYKKVDVADEVKTESQVNVAVEDTAVQDTTVESKLTDTVEWVESTKTGVGTTTGYEEVSKKKIADPSASASAKRNGFPSAGVYGFYTSPVFMKADTSPGQWEREKKGSGRVFSQEDTVSDNNAGGSSGAAPEETPTISLSASASSVEVKGAVYVTATVKPEKYADRVKWSSSDTSIATVSGGTVTGVQAGTVSITAAVEGTDAKASVSLEVKAAETPKLTLSAETLTLSADAAQTLSATVKPDTLSDKTVVWTSADKAIATVDEKGVVTGVKAGTVTITAALKTDASVKAECKVTVTAKETASVTLSQTTGTAYIDGTLSLSATVKPDTLSDKTLVWTSADKAIATVSEKGVVTGVKAGTVTITAALKADASVKAECKVTVRTDPKKDTETVLKDTDGNALYYKDGDEYKPAHYAEYYKYDTFYKKVDVVSEYAYTGWQTIDGKTYFFDKNGNKVTGEQIIQGAKYAFGSDGVLQSGSGSMGIDVSKWNGSIDWSAVKNSGVAYAIIRCGYRGSTTGALIQDSSYATNVAGASAAGIKVGVYFFTQAINEVEAVEEASMVLELVKGKSIKYPIFLDVEAASGGRANGIDRGTRTAVINAFCRTIQNSGYTAGVYANKTWLNEKINTGALGGYKVWLAQYAAQPTYGGSYQLWQYSSKGSVTGIKGNVDLDVSYLGY